LEYVLTHSYKPAIISYMKAHPDDFEEIINLAVSDKQPYSWRASWSLWSCMVENDRRIQKCLDEIIEVLPLRGDNQQRELLIILQRMELNDHHEGKVFDICVNIWKKIRKQPSLRYNAMKMMVEITKKHPELSQELKFLMESHYTDSLSVAANKSIARMVKGI